MGCLLQQGVVVLFLPRKQYRIISEFICRVLSEKEMMKSLANSLSIRDLVLTTKKMHCTRPYPIEYDSYVEANVDLQAEFNE